MTAKKTSDRRQNRATKDRVVELVPGGLVIPDAPKDWGEETTLEWVAFWSDAELVSIVRPSHRSQVVRLFDWRDKLRVAWAEAAAFRSAVGEAHLVRGSTGQMVANPLYALAEKAEGRALHIEGRVEALEDRFGLTPGSMLKLGVDFQKRQSLEARNRQIAEALRDVDHRRSEADDPRALPGDSAVGSS